MFNWLRESVEQVRAELVKQLPTLVERGNEHIAEILTRGFRRVGDADRMTLLWCGLFVAGALIVVIGNAVPMIGTAGDGYFLRAGILLGGAGLAKLLSPSHSQHG